MPDVVTKDQIRDLIKSENLRPSDLFETEHIVADPIVKGYAEDRIKERIGAEFARRKDAEEKLTKLQEGQGDKEADLLKQIATLKAGAAKAQLGPMLDKQKADRKLDDRQLKFIQSRMSKFEPKNPDELDKEFNSWLDDSIDEFGSLAKDVFGIKAEDPKGEPKGGEPDNRGASGDAGSKYLDPKQNPFIKTG